MTATAVNLLKTAVTQGTDTFPRGPVTTSVPVVVVSPRR